VKINFYLLEYAINALLRQKTKNLFIFMVFTFLVFLITTVFLISNSLKNELNLTVDSLPQMIIQNTKAGRIAQIDTSIADDILNISGVQDVVSRVWGYYYFTQANVNFTIIGIDKYEQQYKKSLETVSKKYNFDKADTPSMVIGVGVSKIMAKYYYKNYFNFILPDGSMQKVIIDGIFQNNLELESNDTIIMSKDILRKIFDIDDDKATDIVVKIKNHQEIETIKQKIQQLYPNLRIITNDDLKVNYKKLFDYKNGIYLALFTIILFTFFMIVYDKSSGLNAQEKQEIGILKALGWKVDDILKEKFYESFIISMFAYVLGICMAYFFVFILNAPYLKYIFIGFSGYEFRFDLNFIFDMQTLVIVFLLTIPIYISATIIPSWKVAILDTDEATR
jgi:ABC-type lipoprotein release transport system permease subunit